MKHIAKWVRVVSVAPTGAALLLILVRALYPQDFSSPWEFWFGISVLVALPLLSYPIQRIFRVFPGDLRSGERNLAIVFSFVGYLAGIIVSLLVPFSADQKIIYMTYFLSGTTIAILSFGLKIKASGHMCGVSGPISLIIVVGGWKFLPLILILGFVFWSSLTLKRHTRKELILGSLIPIIAMIASIGFFH